MANPVVTRLLSVTVSVVCPRSLKLDSFLTNRGAFWRYMFFCA